MSQLQLVTQIRTIGQQEMDRLAQSVQITKAGVDALSDSQARLNATLGTLSTTLANLTAQLERKKQAQEDVAKASDQAGESFLSQMVAANVLTEALQKVVEFTKEYTVEAAKYAARTETVAVVMDKLAQVNHLSTGAVRAQVQEVKALGITTQDAMAVINRMVFAQLDLKRAAELARLAQNAGVIANINSSEALQGIVHGIVTRQPEVLRTYGITVDFERKYAEVARTRQRELTANEKVEIALQEVLKQGTRIQGAYEASMLTAGKQMQSLARYSDEAKNAIGQGLLPVMSSAVMMLTRLGKYAAENGEMFSDMAKHITSAGLAMAAFKVLPGGPMVKGVGAGLAFLGGEFLLNTDPLEALEAQGKMAVSSQLAQRARLQRRLDANQYNNPEERQRDQEALKGLKDAAATIAETLANQLAQVYITKGKDIPYEADRLAQGMDLGGGIKVTRGEVLQAIQDIQHPDPRGATQDVAAIKESDRQAKAAAAAAKFEASAKAAKEKMDSLMVQLYGLTEGEAAKYAAVIADFEKDLAPFLKGDPRLGKARAMMATQLAHLTDKDLDAASGILRKAHGNSRWESFRDLLPSIPAIWQGETQADMVTVDQHTADRVNNGGISGTVSRVLAAQQRALEFNIRMVELTAGPGGEIAAIEKVTKMRMDSAQHVYNVTKDLAAFEAAKDQARYDREIKLAELQKHNLEEYKQGAGRIFDALVQSGRTGLKDLVKGQLLSVGRTMFMNAAGMLMGNKSLGLPGVSPDSSLGKILAGTPLDPAKRQADVAAQQQTSAAQTQVQAAQIQLQAAQASQANSCSVPDDLSGDISGAGEAAGGGAGGSAGALASTTAGKGIASMALKWAGIGGALTAGTLGAVSGIKQGGIGGALTASGSIIGGGLSALSMMSKSFSALGPWGAVAGMGLGLLGSLFGHSKADRAQEINNSIEANKKTWVEGRSVTSGIWGSSSYDVDAQGKARVIVQQTINVPIKAFDAKSVYDARADIADAVAGAVREGHAVVPTLRARLAY
jgi:hypothetical protein